MKKTTLHGIEIEYDEIGSGEPLVLISPVLADGFVPLAAAPELRERSRIVTYHKRGWVGSTHTPGPVSIGDHVVDAVALLDHLGIPRAHVGGHSSGAAVAMQLAIDHPARVHSLVLLEPSLLTLPHGRAFLAGAEPVLAAYQAGDHAGALAMFLAAVSGLPWERCRAILEERVPGIVEQALRDADTFFGVELPALAAWQFTPAQAAAITQPTLSVLGSDTAPLWIEVNEMLRKSVRQLETLPVPGAGHLLHLQQPAVVARGIAAFLSGHPMR